MIAKFIAKLFRTEPLPAPSYDERNWQSQFSKFMTLANQG